MKKMLAAAIGDMESRPETVLFAHAVTNHPYTQKTCHRYGFLPTALLFGFIPDTIRFRAIHEQLTQRESVFMAVRLMRPLPRQRLFPPPGHAETIRRILSGFGLSLAELSSEQTPPGPIIPGARPEGDAATTVMSSAIVKAINIATIDVTRVGREFSAILAHEHRRLCRERVDMVYVTFDLGDPGAAAGVQTAESLGFFLAGLMPMQPFPFGLAFQFPNTVKVDFATVTTDGEQAAWIKQTIERERERVEQASLQESLTPWSGRPRSCPPEATDE
jgi:hypothetical protein